MDEYISREEAVKKIKSCISTENDAWEIGYNTAMAEIMEYIKHIPAADVQLVKHGKWMGTVCTACGESDSLCFNHDFCPNCGARMDGGEEE